jgi:ABC-2 type transport system ATP-binding protein
MSILVQDYYKVYGKIVAADGITFSVAPGDILGLVGPNGAGKTTTLRAMAGILAPTRGKIVIAGHDMAIEPVAAKGALAYVPDDPRLFDQLTVWEHFVFIAKSYRLTRWEARANELLATFELTDKRNALCSELSRGMRQKVAICCGYLHQPKAIMLDEPLTGLDPYGIRSMKGSIRKYAAEGAAVIVSSHLLSLVEDLCTSVLVLHRGKQLLHASLAEMRRTLREQGRHETLEELFFRLTEDTGTGANGNGAHTEPAGASQNAGAQ